MEAATRLPIEVRAQIEAVSTVGGSEPNGASSVSPAALEMGSRDSSGDGSHGGPSPVGMEYANGKGLVNGNGAVKGRGNDYTNGRVNGYGQGVGVSMGLGGNGTIDPSQLTR